MLKIPDDFTGGLIIFGIMFTVALIELYILKKRVNQAIAAPFAGQFMNPAPASLVGGFKEIERKCKAAYKSKKKIERCISDSLSGSAGSGGAGGASWVTGKTPYTAAQQ